MAHLLGLSLLLAVASAANIRTCTLPTIDPAQPRSSMDIVIGLSMSETGANTGTMAVEWRHAICYAHQEIYRYMPGDRFLKWLYINDLEQDYMGRQTGLAFVNHTVDVVVGSVFTSVSIELQKVLRTANIPQISFSATAPELSDKTTYPTFFRTIPSDTVTCYSMIMLLQRYGVKSVSVLYLNTQYGIGGMNQFQSYANLAHINVLEKQWYDATNIANQELAGQFFKLKIAATTVIVTFCLPESCYYILDCARKNNILQRPYIWIMSDGGALWSVPRMIQANLTLLPPLLGLDSTVIALAADPGSGSIHDQLTTDLTLAGYLEPGKTVPNTYTYYAYDAVMAIGYAFSKISLLANGNVSDHAQLNAALAEVKFTGASGEVYFDSKTRDRITKITVSCWRGASTITPIGSWTLEQGLSLFIEPTFFQTSSSLSEAGGGGGIKNLNVPAIIGGVVGGVACVAIVVVLAIVSCVFLTSKKINEVAMNSAGMNRGGGGSNSTGPTELGGVMKFQQMSGTEHHSGGLTSPQPGTTQTTVVVVDQRGRPISAHTTMSGGSGSSGGPAHPVAAGQLNSMLASTVDAGLTSMAPQPEAFAAPAGLTPLGFGGAGMGLTPLQLGGPTVLGSFQISGGSNVASLPSVGSLATSGGMGLGVGLGTGLGTGLGMGLGLGATGLGQVSLSASVPPPQ